MGRIYRVLSVRWRPRGPAILDRAGASDGAYTGLDQSPHAAIAGCIPTAYSEHRIGAYGTVRGAH